MTTLAPSPRRRADRSLFVLGGDETGLAIVRNAARLGIRPTVIARPDDITTWSRLAECVIVDKPHGAESLSMLSPFPPPGERSPLVATNDRWLRFIRAHRTQLDERFTVLHPSNEALDTCLSKRRFAEWASAAGLPTPALIDVPEPGRLSQARAASLPFPLFIRPEWSNQAWPSVVPKATPVHDTEALLACMRAFEAAGAPWVATRSLLPAARVQYSVALAVRGGECLSFVAQKVRPFPDQCAVGSYVALHPHAGAEALARAALSAMKFDFGIAEVEIIGTHTGELMLIEINPRPWSQFALSYRSGHDFLAFLLNRASGPPAARRREGLAWIDVGNDLFACFSRTTGLVRLGRLGLPDYLRSLARVRVASTFTITDPYPAVRRLLLPFASNPLRRLRDRRSNVDSVAEAAHHS